MTCTQCGAMLVAGSAFCGGCGRPVAAASPVPQQAPSYALPPYAAPPLAPHPTPYAAPAGHYPQAPAHAPHAAHSHQPQQHLMHQPPPQAPGSGAWQPAPGLGMSPHATPPLGQGQLQAAPLRPYPIVMQQRLTRLTGQMFLAPTRLFFVCESTKGGLAIAIGKGVGGLIGGAIAAFGAPTPGQAAPVIDEPTLYRAVQERQGSLVMEPPQIKQIKDTFWTHAIWFNGLTYALPEGLHKDLKRELGLWCQANGVKSAGLLPKQ
ncbi:MAG: hypothetical protein AB7P03_08395 [Kofleriaceae bacterium]